MFQRKLSLALVAAAACLAGAAPLNEASAAPFDRDFPSDWSAAAINCKKAQFTPNTTICSDAGLKKSDIQIADAYRHLNKTYKDEDQRIFQAGQQLWMIERNNCRNFPVVRGGPGIFECVRVTMNRRLETLHALAKNPSGLKTTVANYPFVYPSYLSAFAQQYVGKSVSVAGAISIEACKGSHKGSLIGNVSDSGKLIEIRFKSLPPDQIEFLCSQRPFSWWEGELRTEKGKTYLFATDILGVPLH